MKTLIAVVFLTIVLHAQLSGPKIFVPNNTYDFGEITEGETASYNFIIVNNGGDELKIERVISSCGCTAAEPQKRNLAPGESTLLNVAFNSTNREGNQYKVVTLITNDPDNKEQRLIVQGKVVPKKKDTNEGPKAYFEKTQHDFGLVDEGVVLPVIFTVKNNGKKDLEIKDIKTSCGCTAANPDKKLLKPGETTKIKVELDTSNRMGKMRREVSVFTNDEENPRQILTLYAEIKQK